MLKLLKIAYISWFSSALRPISTGLDVVEDIVFVSRHLQVLKQIHSCLYNIHSKIPSKKILMLDEQQSKNKIVVVNQRDQGGVAPADI
jgi:hypothetical protein